MNMKSSYSLSLMLIVLTCSNVAAASALPLFASNTNLPLAAESPLRLEVPSDVVVSLDSGSIAIDSHGYTSGETGPNLGLSGWIDVPVPLRLWDNRTDDKIQFYAEGVPKTWNVTWYSHCQFMFLLFCEPKLTIRIPFTTALGDYPITIVAASENYKDQVSATVTFHVTMPPLIVFITPSHLVITRGESGNVTVIVRSHDPTTLSFTVGGGLLCWPKETNLPCTQGRGLPSTWSTQFTPTHGFANPYFMGQLIITSDSDPLNLNPQCVGMTPCYATVSVSNTEGYKANATFEVEAEPSTSPITQSTTNTTITPATTQIASSQASTINPYDTNLYSASANWGWIIAAVILGLVSLFIARWLIRHHAAASKQKFSLGEEGRTIEVSDKIQAGGLAGRGLLRMVPYIFGAIFVVIIAAYLMNAIADLAPYVNEFYPVNLPVETLRAPWRLISPTILWISTFFLSWLNSVASLPPTDPIGYYVSPAAKTIIYYMSAEGLRQLAQRFINFYVELIQKYGIAGGILIFILIISFVFAVPALIQRTLRGRRKQ